jgi:ABC-type multidrug transport system ATPase subunit
MGASGAGKTTLLNVLACRVPRKHLKGQICANGVEYSFKNFGDFANYVMQTDVLMQTLTVRETLEFAANLKLNISEEEKKERIGLLCNKLKLEKCLDVVVGGVILKGVSGGERKRTSIAFELISDPQVILLDEPTSGLDSLTSFIIVRYLKKLAMRQNKTVIMTIHQPNSDIVHLFDRLILLVEGRIIYQGPNEDARSYFSTQFNLNCP